MIWVVMVVVGILGMLGGIGIIGTAQMVDHQLVGGIVLLCGVCGLGFAGVIGAVARNTAATLLPPPKQPPLS